MAVIRSDFNIPARDITSNNAIGPTADGRKSVKTIKINALLGSTGVGFDMFDFIAFKNLVDDTILVTEKIKYDMNAWNKTRMPPTNKTPPYSAKPFPNPENACEYPMAFQLFPVIQYLRNSVKTQMNGAAKKAHVPNLRSRMDKIAANIPGKMPVTAVTQNNRKYARIGGKPA